MKLSLFWLILDEFCNYSTNFKQTHQNKRKLGEIRRHSTKYTLYKRLLIGVQDKIFRKIFFLNVMLALNNAANIVMRSETASNLLRMCKFYPMCG